MLAAFKSDTLMYFQWNGRNAPKWFTDGLMGLISDDMVGSFKVHTKEMGVITVEPGDLFVMNYKGEIRHISLLDWNETMVMLNSIHCCHKNDVVWFEHVIDHDTNDALCNIKNHDGKFRIITQEEFDSVFITYYSEYKGITWRDLKC